MKKNKLTPNQEQFYKEKRRIEKGLKQAEKRGYIRTDEWDIKKPKRITKKYLNELKNIKPKDIFIKGEFLDFETGEIVKAIDAKDIFKRRKKEKEEDFNLIDYKDKDIDFTLPTFDIEKQIRDLLKSIKREHPKPLVFDDKEIQDYLVRIFDDNLLSSDNEDDYLKYLENNYESIQKAIEIIEFSSDNDESVDAGLSTLVSILNNGNFSDTMNSLSNLYDTIYN